MSYHIVAEIPIISFDMTFTKPLIAQILQKLSAPKFNIGLSNLVIVMPPDLGIAELLQPLFQTGPAFLGSLMSLSEKIVSGLPFF